MLTTIKERLGREENDEGFTLIELMVVVLIIAILLAIAIPTFLGARNSANARASQSNLRNSLTAEQTYFTNNQSFSNVVADMQAVEPNLGWTIAVPAQGGNQVFIGDYVAAGTVAAAGTDTSAPGLYLQAWGQDGNCYAILQVNSTIGAAATPVSPGTYYNANKGTCTIPPPSFAGGIVQGAAGAKASNNLGTSWYQSW